MLLWSNYSKRLTPGISTTKAALIKAILQLLLKVTNVLCIGLNISKSEGGKKRVI